MNRRNFNKILVVGVGSLLLSLFPLYKVVGQNRGRGRGRRQSIIRGRRVDIEEGIALPEIATGTGRNRVVERPVIARAVVRGNQQNKTIDLSLNPGTNNYVTGYFPFGAEFETAESAVDAIIESGQLNLE